jgi:hypothetical protein
VPGKLGMVQLIELLAGADVLEQVLSQVEEGDAGRESVNKNLIGVDGQRITVLERRKLKRQALY